MKGSKKIVGTAVGMVALLAIGGTFAYYTGETSIDNTLETASYGDELVEVFTPDDDWEPGETVDKIVGVTNTGDYDIVVRVSMSEAWYDAEGSEIITIASTDTSAGFLDASATTADQLSATDGLIDDSQDTVNNEESLNVGTDAVVDNEIDGSVVYKALTTESDATTTDSWYYNSSDGYWYYTSILASGESTGSLLSSLTLAED
ncbi:MAG: BsaA family SipW-dependent biofilm matrix protein, partial [Eubacteriales bacterium]